MCEGPEGPHVSPTCTIRASPCSRNCVALGRASFGDGLWRVRSEVVWVYTRRWSVICDRSYVPQFCRPCISHAHVSLFFVAEQDLQRLELVQKRLVAAAHANWMLAGDVRCKDLTVQHVCIRHVHTFKHTSSATFSTGLSTKVSYTRPHI